MLSSTFSFLIGFGCGLTVIKYHHIAKPKSWYDCLNDTFIMKTIILIFFIIFLGHSSFGQTESVYYKAPFDTSLSSKYLNKNCKITVILPKGYSKLNSTKMPLIIVFDRQNKMIFRQIYESINYLVSFSQIPESIIIGVSIDDNERNNETSLSISRRNGKGELTNDFVFNELIPYAEKELNVSNCRALIGHSRFGYLTSYMLIKNLNNLSAVISCSPLFTDTNVNLIDSLKDKMKSNTLNHKLYFRFITGDSIVDTKDYSLMKDFLSKTKAVKNFDWKGFEFYDAKHNTTPGLGVMPSLFEIFSYYSNEANRLLTQDKLEFNRNDYDAFLNKMKNHYGAGISLGLSVLNGIGFKYYNNKKYREARAVWDILIQEYPLFSDTYSNIAKSYSKEGNKAYAIKFYELAKQKVMDNPFYSVDERLEDLKDIERKLLELSN